MRRSKLEIPIVFFSVVGGDTYEGPEETLLGLPTSGLVSFGATPVDPTVNFQTGFNPADGDRFGAIRAFLKALPEGLKLGDVFYLPTMANRSFGITAIDGRGTLPGKYPYRLEAVGR